MRDYRAETVPTDANRKPDDFPVFAGDKGGFIYFMSNGEGAIKIGFSGAPVVRKADLQNATPQKLRIMFTLPGTMSEERALHRKFKHIRIRGEWFRDDGEITAYIESLKPKPPRADIVPVTPEFLQECRRLTRYIDRSFIPAWKRDIAARAWMAASAVDQPAFTQNATFQRACLNDIAAFASA